MSSGDEAVVDEIDVTDFASQGVVTNFEGEDSAADTPFENLNKAEAIADVGGAPGGCSIRKGRERGNGLDEEALSSCADFAAWGYFAFLSQAGEDAVTAADVFDGEASSGEEEADLDIGDEWIIRQAELTGTAAQQHIGLNDINIFRSSVGADDANGSGLFSGLVHKV